MRSIQTGQLRDGFSKVIPGVFLNPVAKAQETKTAYAEVDLEVEVAGPTIYATEDIVVKIAGVEIDLPGDVVIRLPWLVRTLEVKRKTTDGKLYIIGGY